MLFTQVPDLDSIDFKAFNIVQRINHLIEERKKAIDVRRQEYEEWLEKLKALPKEQQDIFHKDKYLPGFPVQPRNIESYSGVLMGEDVPVYLAGALISYCRQYGISIFFDFLHYENVKVKEIPTDVDGISEVITEPRRGDRHSIVKIY